MANILNFRAVFHRFKAIESRSSSLWKQKLKLQSIGGLFESTKFEKVKGRNIVKCAQKKYFSYNRQNCFAYKKFFKNFGYPGLVFVIVFVIIFINSIYQSCIPS